MVKYLLTNRAVEDLTNIWNYTFDQWSENQADNYYQMLISNCEEIGANPKLGKKYDGVKSGLLGLRTNKHIIFYREIADNQVEITRILHGTMDLKNRLLE
jgi:toxin ParE1/3/4